jgi:FkbM family methyltransferase
MRRRQALTELLVRPYVQRELPGWGHLYGWFAGSDGDWADAGMRRIAGKLHGYTMELDISGWSQRYTYFLGRYYDLPTQQLLQAVLRPGDRVCDIGANIGMISLLAAHLVGPSGRVEAFEPNPACAEKIRQLIAENELGQVHVHVLGLSDEPATLTLSVPLINSGEASFAPPRYPQSELRQVTVDVKRGDDVIDLMRPPAVIKIDVEGFECRVIDGLRGVLSSAHPLVITEVVAEHLTRGGGSAQGLFERMNALGYSAYELGLRKSGLKHLLRLTPVTLSSLRSAVDVVWIHEPTHGKLPILHAPYVQ